MKTPNKKKSPRFRELRFTLRMIKRSKITLAAIGLIILFYIMAAFAPWIAPYDPDETHLKDKLVPPNKKYLLGTDSMGRDVLSRLIYGMRISMLVGVVVVTIMTIIGLPLGAIAGYFGGKVDEVIMRTADIFMSFPGLTLVMVFAYLMGRGFISAIVGLSMINWTITARMMRGSVISEKEKEYVTAAKALGKSDLKILFGEILPNSLQPIICLSMMYLGTSIIEVAGLSFVGVGTQPPTSDWGVMISRGRRFLIDQPWYAITPGILIIVVVLAFTLIGDALSEALDPRLRRQLR